MFTQGGVNQFQSKEKDGGLDRRFNGGRSGYTGWIGMGGSSALWNRNLGIGFGYSCTLINWLDPFNRKSGELLAVVSRCTEMLMEERSSVQRK